MWVMGISHHRHHPSITASGMAEVSCTSLILSITALGAVCYNSLLRPGTGDSCAHSRWVVVHDSDNPLAVSLGAREGLGGWGELDHGAGGRSDCLGNAAVLPGRRGDVAPSRHSYLQPNDGRRGYRRLQYLTGVKRWEDFRRT